MRFPVAIGGGLLFVGLALLLDEPGPLDVGPDRPPLTAEELPKGRFSYPDRHLDGLRQKALEDIDRRRKSRVVIVREGADFRTDAQMNGQIVPVLIDTLAAAVIMDLSTARRIGIDLREHRFDRKMDVAGVSTPYANVTIDRVEIDGIILRRVEARVLSGEARHPTRLGMSFLNRLRRITFNGDQLTLDP